MITAKIIADSKNECGDRITSWVLKYPRFIHSELMTHREFSRNASSSRAVPVQKMIDAIVAEPACPVSWGKNQKGMQASEELDLQSQADADQLWHQAMLEAVESAKAMINIGVHKQIANRLLEPFAHMTTLVTATNFENFFALRAHKDAQPEFKVLAELMLSIYNDSEPKQLKAGEWHLPFADKYVVGLSLDKLPKISTARAARVSYNNFEGDMDFAKDFELHDNLAASGHWSPFEHPAVALAESTRSGNFKGFKQYRKFFAEECRRDPRVIKK